MKQSCAFFLFKKIICRTRDRASDVMCELGKKSKNGYNMRDIIFWKLHQLLKDEIDKKHVDISRRIQKKRKKLSHVPNWLACSSARLSVALRIFTGVFTLVVALAYGDLTHVLSI